MQIRKSELKKTYGLDLKPGLYRILNNSNSYYSISSVIDHTSGCILVGNATNHTDFVSDSRAAMKRVMELLEGQSDITIKVE